MASGPGVPGHLLGGHDGDEQGQRGREPRAERLADAQPDEARRERPGGREQRTRRRRPAGSVRRRPRRSAAATTTEAAARRPGLAASTAPGPVGGAELVGRERDGLGDEGARVPGDQREGGETGEGDRRRRRRSGPAASTDAGSGLGLGQATATGTRKTAPAGDGELVGDLLGHPRPPSTGLGLHRALVVPGTVPRRIRSDPGPSAASATIGSSRGDRESGQSTLVLERRADRGGEQS